MIDARELRIGNYLEKSLKSGQGRKLIDKIICQDIVRIFENTGSFNYEPIPLTEELLLKCGFEQGGYAFMEFWIDDFHIMGMDFETDDGDPRASFATNYWLYRTPEFGGYKHKQIELLYLHQLQNLYFSLTGKELEINL